MFEPMGFTRDLVERARSIRLEGVPAAAIAVAKSTLLDTLAVALAGRAERVVVAVEGFVADEHARGPVTIWGSSLRASATGAALVNGAAAHALDYDDVCWAMNAHPSAVLWPTALAVAEATGASGAAALESYVAGFEAAADVGSVLGHEHYAAGFHPTATIGAIAAAVAAGKLLGLDADALSRAVGIACSQAAGTRINFGTDTKPLHAGLAARAGITAASLARRGVTSQKDAIEAPMGLAALYRGTIPGSPRTGFALLDPGVELKPYPSCRFTHRVIDAALAIRSRHPQRTAESIECTVDPFSTSVVIYPRPSNALEAKFSMEYAAAAAWLDGRVGVGTFRDGRVAEDDVQRLLRRVVVSPGTKAEETVRIAFTDGGSDEETVQVARGSPSRPLTRAERLSKFHDLAGPCLAANAETVADLVDRIDAIDDIVDFSVRLRPAPSKSGHP